MERAIAESEEKKKRKQYQNDLLKTVAQFQLIADSSSDVIFQLDLSGKIIYISQAMQTLKSFPNENNFSKFKCIFGLNACWFTSKKFHFF